MNTIFKYNGNTKYSTKDLKGGHNTNHFSLLYVYYMYYMYYYMYTKDLKGLYVYLNDKK